MAEKAFDASWAMVGRPYKYSGHSPQGFDCSGLVLYSYRKAGIELPHGTAELRQISRTVSSNEMRKGDLIFFDINGRKYSHVGIYAGNNRFIHAASSRKAVRIDNLLDAYWKERLREVRRLAGADKDPRFEKRSLVMTRREVGF
jgi:cell wall-associated NlpC family hydrolase